MAQVSTITSDLFEPFGSLEMHKTMNLTNSFGSAQPANISNSCDKFKTFCKDVLNGNSNGYSSVYVNQLIYSSYTHDPTETNTALINAFNCVTQEFCVNIQNQLSENKFSLESFYDMYKMYCTRSSKLKKYLWYYSSKTSYVGRNNNNYSYIDLVKNYLFYHNVINSEYNYNGSSDFFYTVLNTMFSTTKMDYETILPIFKIYRFYGRLAHVLGEEKHICFNVDIDNTFMTTLGTNPEFVKNLSIYIHDHMKKYFSQQASGDDASAEDIKTIVLDTCKIVASFTDKNMYLNYHHHLMKDRIFSWCTSVALEKEILTILQGNKPDTFITRMAYIVQDAEESDNDMRQYKKLGVTAASDKYKSFNPLTMDRDIFKVNVVRNHTNDDEVTDNNIQLPKEIEPYFDVYESMYAKLYAHRTLTWNYDDSISVAKIELNGKEYYIQMTVLQMMVLLTFNDKDKISALELHEMLNISLGKIGKVLNSFLKVGIFLRDDGLDNDPTVPFCYNESFKYEASSRISIVKYMKDDVGIPLESGEIDQQVNAVQKIISLVSERKQISKADLFKSLEDKHSMNTTDIMKGIKKSIEMNYIDINIVNSVEIYSFKQADDSDSEYESDSDPESESESDTKPSDDKDDDDDDDDDYEAIRNARIEEVD